MSLTWSQSTPVLNAYIGYAMEFPKIQDKFPKRSQCLPKHVLKTSFVFNSTDSHSTLFKLFKRVNRKQTKSQTHRKPWLPLWSYKHPVPLPGDNWCYHKHTVLEISFKNNIVQSHVTFTRWMETSDVLMSWKWVVWCLELNFWGILQRFHKCCIINISDSAECVPGTAVLEDKNSRYTVR